MCAGISLFIILVKIVDINYREILITLKITSPDGILTVTFSPFFLPNKPFPIGDSTDILPSSRFASSSDTITYSNDFLSLIFSIFTFERIDTLSVLISFSSIILALDRDSSSFDIFNSCNP